jgi:hypothetical protein
MSGLEAEPGGDPDVGTMEPDPDRPGRRPRDAPVTSAYYIILS